MHVKCTKYMHHPMESDRPVRPHGLQSIINSASNIVDENYISANRNDEINMIAIEYRSTNRFPSPS